MKHADRSAWADVVSECPDHGEHKGIICPDCFDIQRIRIELESAELRAQRTPEFMRRQVARLRAGGNGRLPEVEINDGFGI
jgi:hypothetical protein